jgi:hypothetical protein
MARLTDGGLAGGPDVDRFFEDAHKILAFEALIAAYEPISLLVTFPGVPGGYLSVKPSFGESRFDESLRSDHGCGQSRERSSCHYLLELYALGSRSSAGSCSLA